MYKTKPYIFSKAKPVWAENREKELNLWLDYTCSFNKGKDNTLSLTGSSAYNVFVNGTFVFFGPARCAHGYYRVDDFDLTPFLKDGENELLIKVAGYNCNSFYHLDQPSFFCGELKVDNSVLYASGTNNDFTCFEDLKHEELADRYSYQRTFCETYNHNEKNKEIKSELTENKNFIYRNCPFEKYPIVHAEKLVSKGTFTMGDHEKEYKLPRHIALVGNKSWTGGIYSGYDHNIVTTKSSLIARNIDVNSLNEVNKSELEEKLLKNEFAIYKFKTFRTGIISLTVNSKEDSELIVTFSDILIEDGTVNFRRIGTSDVVIHRFSKGKQTLLTFEPYALQYISIYTTKSDVEILDVSLIAFESETNKVSYVGSDEALSRIVDAAVNTYKQNTFTIFMDCPGRERAGWLCDSFFTSRVERTITDKSIIEKNFLENFLLPESFKYIPNGMLPMCYPGDQYDGSYIPNWAMWYVIELEEYFNRTHDKEFIDMAKDKVYALIKFFEKYENTDSLLEKLESWVFIEWSKCNQLTQDVNFPSNMLYSYMLRKAGILYSDDSLIKKADIIKDNINKMAKIGMFYCDNALRKETGLELSGYITETCQYYAFFTGVATKEDNKELFDELLSKFGPDRDLNVTYPDIYPSNAFIGDYLRLEVLFLNKKYDKVLDNIKGYFDIMARTTGTLWENNTIVASCCHGFASHILYWLDKMGYLKIEK